MLAMAGCKPGASQGSNSQEVSAQADEQPGQAQASRPQLEVADEGHCSFGSHRYTMEGNFTAAEYRRDATGTVTFTNVPSDYEEFEALYTRFLGKTPHGTAAMVPMAMELYARDADLGQRCFELICTPSNVNSVVSVLRQKFNSSQYGPSNDGYVQRYLPAAALRGATPENGYTPSLPYAVDMTASANAHRDMQIMGSGRVVYIYIYGGGWDTHQRSVEVLLPQGAELHQVFNCPALYTQCKAIQGQWPGLR